MNPLAVKLNMLRQGIIYMYISYTIYCIEVQTLISTIKLNEIWHVASVHQLFEFAAEMRKQSD